MQITKVLAIDLETTGLDAGHHEITQVGAILCDDKMQKIATFESLVRIKHPKRGIRKDFNVFEYTGITQESLKTAPTLETVLKKLVNFVKNKGGLKADELRSVVILGQNPGFDKSHLEAAFKSIGSEYPFDYHSIDISSMFMVYHLLQEGKTPPKLSMKYMIEYFELEPGVELHNAMNDIVITIALFKVIKTALQIGSSHGA